MKLPSIQLLPAKEESVKRGHPWVFSRALAKSDVRTGLWAQLEDHNGKYLGIGITEAGSIAFKWVGSEQWSPKEFIQNRIQRAFQFRKQLGYIDRNDLEIYRLFFAEGDGLPGLIIDIYGVHAVVQLYSYALMPYTELIAKELVSLGYSTVFLKCKQSLHDDKLENLYLMGEKQGDTFLENGIPFLVDWEHGQKTGFFIDQRNNRQRLRELSAGKNVLNVFSYTGGFSSYALMGGAKSVVSLDSSKPAIELAERNASQLDVEGKHEGITQDAFEFVKNMPDDFDIVVLDPPAFAKNHHARHKAVQAYKRINSLAMKKMKPGSWLFTFSCSQHITRELFVSTIRAAAIDSGRELKLVEHLQQAADHPSSLLHPEGEYLKGVLLQMQ